MDATAEEAPNTPSHIGNVLYPTRNLASLLTFYKDGLGLPVKFQDGERFAALDGGSITLALATDHEDVAGGVVAASFKVADVSTTVERLVAVGGELVRGPEAGPHELRAVMRDPSGNLLVVYASLA